MIEQLDLCDAGHNLKAIQDKINELVELANSRVNGIPTKDTEKPPLGLKPKFITDEQRAEEIVDAISRYLKAHKPIPMEWFDELKQYTESTKRMYSIDEVAKILAEVDGYRPCVDCSRAICPSDKSDCWKRAFIHWYNNYKADGYIVPNYDIWLNVIKENKR